MLGEDYLALDGLDSFVPTDEQTVTSTTSLVAAREESIAEDFGSEFSVESSPHFHYFLSGKKVKSVVVHCTYVCAREGGGNLRRIRAQTIFERKKRIISPQSSSDDRCV